MTEVTSSQPVVSRVWAPFPGLLCSTVPELTQAGVKPRVGEGESRRCGRLLLHRDQFPRVAWLHGDCSRTTAPHSALQHMCRHFQKR